MRVLFLSVMVCSTAMAQVALVDRVVAFVDGQPILKSDVDRRVSPAAGRDAVLQALIDEQLIADDAATLRVRVEDAEVDQVVSRMAAEDHVNPEQLAEALRQEGLTLAEYRRQVRQQILEVKWIRARNDGALPVPEAFARVRAAAVESLRRNAVIEVRP